MKKLSLNIHALRVESFAADVSDGGYGTVRGAQDSEAVTCFGQPTCVVCTRQECLEPSEPGYATYVNGRCIRC